MRIFLRRRNAEGGLNDCGGVNSSGVEDLSRFNLGAGGEGVCGAGYESAR